MDKNQTLKLGPRSGPERMKLNGSHSHEMYSRMFYINSQSWSEEEE